MPRYEQPARVPKPSPVFVNVLPKGKACLACMRPSLAPCAPSLVGLSIADAYTPSFPP